MFVSRSLEHLCFEQSALEKTSASFENLLILKIEEIKGVIKISEFCDGLLRFYGLTKALSVLNMATKTLWIPLPLAKFQRLYKRPFIPRAGGIVWLYNTYPAAATNNKKMTRYEVLEMEMEIHEYQTS
ncbi:hypothetical protein YC2023_061829 [Brassica napus]